MKRFAIPAAALLALAACGDETAPVEEGDAEATARGEVLGGSISDDMLPLDTVRSQAASRGDDEADGDGGEAASAARPDRQEEPAPEPQPEPVSGEASDPAE